MNEVFIIDAVRTAIGNFGGAISSLSATELGTIAVKSLLERNKLNGKEVDEVLIGCVLQAGQGQNMAPSDCN